MKSISRLLLPAVALLALGATQAQAAMDTKMTVQGLTNSEGFPVYSFSWGVSRTGKIGSVSPLSIMRPTDNYTPNLASACFQGVVYPSAHLVATRPTGDQQPLVVLDIVMTQVKVAAVQLSGSTGGDDRPTESDSFTAASMTINGVTINTSTVAGMQQANKMIAAILGKAGTTKTAAK